MKTADQQAIDALIRDANEYARARYFNLAVSAEVDTHEHCVELRRQRDAARDEAHAARLLALLCLCCALGVMAVVFAVRKGWLL